MPNSVSAGTITSIANNAGTTKNRVGLIPITFSASISWLIFMVPMRAANAEPERPATKMPVINGANSRTTENAMPMVTRLSAPKIRSV